jgi:hypothetical protein
MDAEQIQERRRLIHVEPGEAVRRYFGTQKKAGMVLFVEAVDRRFIYCGPWKFNHMGMEVDEVLGWDGETMTGSWIRPL